MSLKAFHFVFILASITLSIYFGFWCLGEYQDTESLQYLLFAVTSFVSAIGLCFYLIWFLKKFRKVGFLIFLVGWHWVSQVASACPACVGDPNSPMVKSANSGVWLLLAVICTVLSGFAGLFGYWMYRANVAARSAATATLRSRQAPQSHLMP